MEKPSCGQSSYDEKEGIMANGTGWIISAYYGAEQTGSNPGFNDVTALVSWQYTSGGQTKFTASNGTYGPDPDPGVVKALLITYAYTTATPPSTFPAGVYPLSSFQIFTVSIPEGQSATLPAANVTLPS